MVERLSQPKLGPFTDAGDVATPESTAEARARGLRTADGKPRQWTKDPVTGESHPVDETREERLARKAVMTNGRPVGSGLGPSPGAIPAAPDLTDDLLQKSAASTVSRLRKSGRRSTFLDSTVGDSTLLGGL